LFLAIALSIIRRSFSNVRSDMRFNWCSENTSLTPTCRHEHMCAHTSRWSTLYHAMQYYVYRRRLGPDTAVQLAWEQDTKQPLPLSCSPLVNRSLTARYALF